MSVSYGLLGILAKNPQHGYEIKNSFEDTAGGFWNVNYGQIYITLDRLVKKGLVNVSFEHGGKGEGHDRKVYSITKKGRKEFKEWLAQPVDKIRPLRDEIFIKLAFSDPDDPEAIVKLISQQRQLYLIKMAELTRKKQQIQAIDTREAKITDLLVDAALFHAEADLRWLEHCEIKILNVNEVTNKKDKG